MPHLLPVLYMLLLSLLMLGFGALHLVGMHKILPQAWYSTFHDFLCKTSVELLCMPFSKPKKKRVRKKRPTWKYLRKFRRRRLHYHLVHRCRRRSGNRPPRMNGERFDSPLDTKHRRWRRRKAKSKARIWKRRVVDHEFFLSGKPYRFELTGQIDDQLLNEFCFGSNRDFTKLSKLVAEFDQRSDLQKFVEDHDHVTEVERLLQRASSGLPICGLAGSAFEMHRILPTRPSYKNTVLIWDTGASFGLTPFRSDFIDYVEADIPVKDVTKVNRVIGIGTTLHKFKDSNGNDVILPCVSYHLQTTDVRLFSPQTYHQMHDGHSIVAGDYVEMILGNNNNVMIPIDREGSNLPVVHNSWLSKEEQERYGPLTRSALAWTRLNQVDFFGDLQPTKTSARYSPQEREIDLLNSEFEHYSKFCGPCVGQKDNTNLSGPQKELLLWHWKLGISMYRIQEMMRKQKMEEPSGKISELPPIIKPKYKSTPNCNVPPCMSCQLARAKKRSTGVTKKKSVEEKEGILSRDKYKPGDMVSVDQFVVKTPGRQLKGYGREGENGRYHGGTIYNDAASGAIHVENQVTLGAGDTILGKNRFEEWLREQALVEVSHYHGDNGIFTADTFRNDCSKKNQTQSYSGVGAQHQNSRAERSIQTIMYMARTFMVHTSLHWTEYGVDDLSLWSFAVKHAAWLYNRVPNRRSGMTPLELLTNVKADHRDLLRAHVWGCPVYVLDPKLQNDQKIPKWNKRSRLGQFLGFSSEHSSLVALVRHLKTGYVSPQFHVVFDDLYQSVYRSSADTSILDMICDEIFEEGHDWYAEEEYENGQLVYKPPPLHDVWLSEEDRRSKKEQLADQRRRYEERESLKRARIPQEEPEVIPATIEKDLPPTGNAISDDEDSDDDDSLPGPVSESEGDDFGGSNSNDLPASPIPNAASEGAKAPTKRPRKQYPPASRHRGEGGGLRSRSNTASSSNPTTTEQAEQARVNALCPETYPMTKGSKDEPVNSRLVRLSRKRKKYRQRMREKREIGDRMLNAMNLADLPDIDKIMDSPLAKFITFAANDCGYSGSARDLVVNWIHPMFLKAKSAASAADNPSWWEAMQGPFADEYWKAACIEVETLERMKAWDVVDRTPDMHVIEGTWALKLKRFPDGLIKKFKARFCARGDQQRKGIDYFETYAPVVQWTTVRLMLILEVLLKLKSKQGDITAAFLHAEVPEGQNIYVEMPHGFRKKGKCLRLRRFLYGLAASPREFWLYLVGVLEKSGLKQSSLDPCLFIGDKVICIVYVDDLLFWAKDESDIDSVATSLRDLGCDLEQESDAAGFLGVSLERDSDTDLIEMRQDGLIDRVIESLGLDDGMAKVKWTPADGNPLVKDEDGEPASGQFSYSSVVGMLLYLAGHTRPDIAYAVNCCARYMFNPKHIHELALKRIGRYLKATRRRGLILNPSKELRIDNYPDADFAGMYGHEKPTDPSCVKSRTGYTITFANCPVIWQSKLQTETALSTMEAEIVALAHSCREMFPIMDMTKTLCEAVDLPIGEAIVNVSIHEDNAGALVLAQTLPPQFTPRSKHYAAKTIWFREEINKRGIKLLKIDTLEQLGDMFTKGLPRATFEYLRKKLMGW